MIDLQDAKLELCDAQSKPAASVVQNPQFRVSAYTNMNTTTSDMLGLGKTKQKTSSSWFSAGANNNANDPLADLSAD